MNVRRSTAKASVVVTAVALALGLSSCGRGFDAPTDQVYNPGIGTSEQSGSVDVLNAVIVSGEDGSGTLITTLVNNDEEQADKLANISGSNGDEVQVSPPSETTIEPSSVLSFSDVGGARVEGDAVKAGTFVSLTFSFENGASVEVDVPVETPEGPYSEVPLP